MGPKKKIVWFVNVSFEEVVLQNDLNKKGKGWLATLANTLPDKYELHVVSIDPYKKSKKGNKLSLHYLTPKYFKLKLVLNAFWPLKNINGNLLSQMIKIVKEVSPDLIHIHGSEKQFIRIASRPEVKHIPIALSIQGIMTAISKSYTASYPLSFLNTFYAFRGFQKTKWLPQRLLTKYKYTIRQTKIEKDYFRHIDFFFGRTDWDRQISELMGDETTYFKIDRILKPEFYKAVWNSPNQENNKLILHTTLGNAIHKGVDVIAEACSYLIEKGLNFEWRVAGVTEDCWSVRAAKKKLKHKFPKHKLVFLGQLDAKQLINQMLQANLYVMCSYIENSPNNLAEAMIMGMPCVATFAGGTSTYLEHKKQGLLVPTGDALGIAAAIFDLYKNPDKALLYGNNAREASLNRHDPERIQKALINAYASILKPLNK